MLALVRDMTGDHPARPVLVLSNDPAAAGLARARRWACRWRRSITARSGDRAAFEAALLPRSRRPAPDIICLAGFMRVLTPAFVARFRGRMLNIHPSLLPKYPGLHTHARALAAGDAEAGCTVHEVTAPCWMPARSWGRRGCRSCRATPRRASPPACCAWSIGSIRPCCAALRPGTDRRPV
jgi:phosphoribosylglycinamide formyltransferase 1